MRAAAARLRIDSATAEVLRAFDAEGISSVVLKGASNRQWLEDSASDGRWYADCDLLVRPDDHEAVTRVLRGLGFVSGLDPTTMPAWWREHDHSWRRDQDHEIIDIHTTLPGVGVDDDRAWTLLSAGSEEIPVGGYRARALAIPARALHLALHAAHHGPGWVMGFADLERALEQCAEVTWTAAAALANQLGATPAFLAGLSLVPAGRALAERLGVVAAPSLDVLLVGDRARSPALTLERFARADDWRTCLSIVRHKLFPPPTFMRHWSPLARRGRLGLVIAYVRRLLWVLTHLPAAVRSWRRARRRLRHS